MNKLNRTERQRNYFNSIERIKAKLNSESKKPYSRRSKEENEAREAAQKAYNERQRAMAEAKWLAEREQLKKELDSF